MRPSGRVQLWIWRLRVQLRRSAFLKRLVQQARRLRSDSRARHLRNEVRFWRRWLLTEGLEWPEDFKARFDPELPIQDHLAPLIDQFPKPTVDILDVGAGPLTKLGKTHPTKQLSITATDVLGCEYNALLDEFGLEPPVRTRYAASETLRQHIGERQFDIVHAQNTLDHSADPFAALEEMLALTAPGGFVVLLHEDNEGQRELYYALHKWDFSCEDGRFLIRGPGPGGALRDVTAIMDKRAEVECASADGLVLVTMRKPVPQKGEGRKAAILSDA
jgi:SAM-dependent methyltransferase